MRRFKHLIALLLLIMSAVAKGQNISFSVNDNLLFAKIRIEGKQLLFLIDTGSSYSYLDKKSSYIKGLRIKRYEDKSIMITNFSHKSASERLVVATTAIDSLYIATLVIIDLDNLKSRISENLAGILGTDFLIGNKAIIDFKNRVLIINN